MSKTKRNLANHNGNGHNRLEEYLKVAAPANGSTKKPKAEEVLDLSLKANFVARTPNQKKMLSTISNNKLTIVTGPAGVGKTAGTVAMAAKYLSEGIVDRIVMVRPFISCDEDLGFLPGDLNAKAAPFMRPLFDELAEFFTDAQIDKMIVGRRPIAEVVPLAVMKGRTFKKAFIILDEAQDATFKQIKMLLTRMGNASKVVLTGDLSQTDRQYQGLCPLEEIMGKLKGGLEIGFAELDPGDIQRDPMVAQILERI